MHLHFTGPFKIINKISSILYEIISIEDKSGAQPILATNDRLRVFTQEGEEQRRTPIKVRMPYLITDDVAKDRLDDELSREILVNKFVGIDEGASVENEASIDLELENEETGLEQQHGRALAQSTPNRSAGTPARRGQFRNSRTSDSLLSGNVMQQNHEELLPLNPPEGGNKRPREDTSSIVSPQRKVQREFSIIDDADGARRRLDHDLEFEDDDDEIELELEDNLDSRDKPDFLPIYKL